MYFLLARLLIFFCSIVRTVSCARISGPTSATVSAVVTATWILQGSGDADLSQGFSIVLIKDDSSFGEITEWSTTVNPTGNSQGSGTVHATPTAAGKHHMAIISQQKSNAADTSQLEVAEDSGSDAGPSNLSDPPNVTSSGTSGTSFATAAQIPVPATTTSSVNSSAASAATGPNQHGTGGSPSQSTQGYSTSPSADPADSLTKEMVAIVLSAIFGTILLILLLLAAFLWCRRRRSRFKTKAPAVETRRWHDSERFQWGPPQRTSGASRDISSELFETSKTVPMSIWDSPESWDFSTIAPSDSISRVVSLKRTQGRWERGQLAERHSLGNLQSEESTREGRRIHIPAGRSKLDRNSRNNLANEGSDVGTSVVEETSWVHAGGPALIPQARASTAGAR